MAGDVLSKITQIPQSLNRPYAIQSASLAASRPDKRNIQRPDATSLSGRGLLPQAGKLPCPFSAAARLLSLAR